MVAKKDGQGKKPDISLTTNGTLLFFSTSLSHVRSLKHPPLGDYMIRPVERQHKQSISSAQDKGKAESVDSSKKMHGTAENIRKMNLPLGAGAQHSIKGSVSRFPANQNLADRTKRVQIQASKNGYL